MSFGLREGARDADDAGPRLRLRLRFGLYDLQAVGEELFDQRPLGKQVLLYALGHVWHADGLGQPDELARQPVVERIHLARDGLLYQGDSALAQSEDAERPQKLAERQFAGLFHFSQAVVRPLLAKPYLP